MRESAKEELLYLRYFAELARETWAQEDWPAVEALLRDVWPREVRWLHLDVAIEVVRLHFAAPK